jgi:large subunit ribosomal protein L32
VAVPKRRTSPSKRNMRRAANNNVVAPNMIPCPNCGDPCLPHRVCPSCGQYKGRQVVKKASDESAE